MSSEYETFVYALIPFPNSVLCLSPEGEMVAGGG